MGFTTVAMGSSIWASDLNPPEHYPEGIRRIQMIQSVGSIVGALFPGFIADRFGSYVPVYALTVFCAAVFLAGLRFMYRRKTDVVPAAAAKG